MNLYECLSEEYTYYDRIEEGLSVPYQERIYERVAAETPSQAKYIALRINNMWDGKDSLKMSIHLVRKNVDLSKGIISPYSAFRSKRPLFIIKNYLKCRKLRNNVSK